MTTPDEKPSQMQSGYNDQERKGWNDRLKAIEQLLELDTVQAGTRVLGRLLALENGGLAGTGGPDGQGFKSETLTASGAASVSKYLTNLDGTTNASAITLAAPTVDGQSKLIKLVSSAAHHPTLDGTNIRTAAGASEAGKNGTFTSVTAGSVSYVLLESIAGVWVILATNITFA